ncbi:hypothetical protein BDY21DRAFT_338455 [Lineolata rhizophorae]|uniref:MPN domain-containing protein n=1 Tax=Lineolata rhizophorae TaxID=578093 RepID=A0A6A6P694_9PEZI|nr:hypothetical protein BDY21DRAFT_338455 [Lineolata rhizophorae]
MAESGRAVHSVAPMAVQDIVKVASNFDYSSAVPMRYWLRSADTILKEAHIYEREGNDQETYLLLFRHAVLVLEKLGVHPEARRPEYKSLLNNARLEVQRNLAKLEALKPRIDARVRRYNEAVARRNAQRERWERERQQRGDRSVDERLPRDMGDMSLRSRSGSLDENGVYGPKTALEAQSAQNRELAVRIAHSEIRRRDHARRKVRQAGVSEEEEQQRRVAGDWAGWESALARGDGDQVNGDGDISRQILEARRRGDQTLFDAANRSRQGEPSRSSAPARPSSYAHYPSVPHRSLPPSSEREAPAKGILQPPGSFAPSSPPRSLPPKVPLSPPSPLPRVKIPSPPPIPAKLAESDETSPVSRSASATPDSHELSSRNYTFKPNAFLENGTPLRTIFLPPELRSSFLRIAEPNTRRNLETCGILCGTLISNALFISKLLIPEQISTSDTCETVNEEAIFDYCDKEDLMVLGWIHTHPTQTCFMSSRDLHTHAGYQVMMPESIAIVCAPSKLPSWGIFRLTDPPGMGAVQNCRQSGIFHPHAEPNIYTDALKPGHVFEGPGLKFEMVDLRSNS